jgi:hypothetical protein
LGLSRGPPPADQVREASTPFGARPEEENVAPTAVVHEVDRAAHLLARTTLLASLLTLHTAQTVASIVGMHRRSHFAEVCAAYTDLNPTSPPAYLNNRL